ncbi:hypothetical protein PQ460_21890 [Paenibacillus sp. KACC 21273]|uniref:hypothetical protein n=1 Tax=Paenibacillus sp. KACC 21273 TaxID=3025665 RepID=UPI002365E26B|nr:hypothetical protein [Paenibacillus sp. KACC 21273]WDF50588.1 hypothetical protein PQ460_21890 [Paenibacillus sp. KACC 21273]
MYYPLRYIEWSETKQMEVGEVYQIHSLSQEELFVHKLVDAVKLNHRIWVHVSHESIDHEKHTIYVRPFAEELPATYQRSLATTISGQKDYPNGLAPEYWLWDGTQFQRRDAIDSYVSPIHLALRLLDHYLLQQDITYDILYTVLDADRQKVMIFLNEVNE